MCPYFSDLALPEPPPHPDDEGTLKNELISHLDGLLADQMPSTNMRLFTTQDHSTPTYVRNTDNWAAVHVQALTAISPWNSDSAFQKAGILVSPRHVLFATHYKPADGSTIRFVTTGNTVVTRTLSSTISLPNTGSYYPDITIGLLDSDVPGTISYAKVLPAGFETKLPANIQPFQIPCAATDQEEKLIVADVANLPHADTGTEYCGMQVPTSALRLNFNEGLVGGDSGNPACWFINGDLVLLTMWTGAQNGGYGTSVAAFRDDVNTAMTTLGGGYQLTTVDLSTFSDE